MLTANLPVCHYPGMPSQNSNNSVSGSNNNLNIGIDTISTNNNCSTSNSNANNGSNCSSSNLGVVSGGITTIATKNQLEQLNTMREALFSQDGWGCQHVNQDTNWEVPSSPEPANKDPSTPSLWKPNINNGTELWESTLRNGGQPPPQTVQKTPWGHTPSTNLGGTWGEEDDGVENNSVWAGSSSSISGSVSGGGGISTANVASGGSNAGAQWTQVPVGIGGSNTTVPTVSNIQNITTGSAANVAGSGAGSNSVSGTSTTSGSGWGDHRDLRANNISGAMDLRGVDPRDQMRTASAGDPRDMRMIDPRDPIRGDPRGISGRLNGTSEMWGQHHAMVHNPIPGLNKVVGQGGAPAAVQNSGVSNIVPGVGGMPSSNNLPCAVSAQWGNSQSIVGSKDIPNITGKQASGWEEPSPPQQRRNIPNYDDGTSLWGQQSRVPVSGAHWKDIPDPLNRSHLLRNAISNQNSQNINVSSTIGGGNNGNNISNTQSTGIGNNGANNPLSNVGSQNRVGPATVVQNVAGPLKQDTLWTHSNNSSVSCRNPNLWNEEGNHNLGTNPAWADDKPNCGIGQIGSGVNTWNDATAWSKNQNKISGAVAGWGAGNANDQNEINTDWNVHGAIVGKPQKLGGVNVGITGLNSDVVKQSKQYRYLVENGFKKEDVERALMASNMNIDEATEILRSNTLDNWRRHDDQLNSFVDHSNVTAGVSFPVRFGATNLQPQISYPPNNLLNISGSGVGSASNNLSSLNSMQPIQVQKFLNQQPPHNISGGPHSMSGGGSAFNQGSVNLQTTPLNISTSGGNQPSTQQLRMLVQQIQMAVHNGYLSSQILNQPLAPSTLVLLNQLLSSIKHLQTAQQSLRANGSNNLQLNVIAKQKQQIQSLQNQINAQQAMYIKQQQNLQQSSQSHSGSSHMPNTNPDFLRSHSEVLTALPSNFTDISLNKAPSNFQAGSNQQSRLNQWKLPVLDKDDNTDFSRAPGATKQSLSTSAGGNIGHLGLQSDGTWSSNRSIGDGWPDVTPESENKDWSVAPPSTAAATYTDLVQEFEPGKPWKGSQIKSVEDDPNITPGSVARSPLSINSSAKDADLFVTASKSSPTDLPPLGLGSSTWSFNPTPSNQAFSSWSDNSQQCSTAELWSAQINKSSRGPPPGLANSKHSAVPAAINHSAAVVGTSNAGWLVSGNRALTTGWTGSSNTAWSSNWLLLKNLTPQIDGSTLRTLCMQHGHPVSFHLYLNQGFALCKYATHEEASKAQMTLNNCVLSNSTICAESPSDNEVQNLIQHLPQNANNGQNLNPTANCGNSNNCNSNGNATNVLTSSSNTVSVSSSANNCSNTLVPLSGGNSANNAIIPSTLSSNISNGQPTITSSSAVAVNSNSSATTNNHTTWRQVTQNQQQSQSRNNTGRETDFDYISKFVCSIVDD